MRRSIVTFKCYKGDQETIEEHEVLSKDIDDETSNVLELLYEIRIQKGYDRMKYMRIRAA